MFRTIFNYMDRRIYINEHNEYKEINSSSPKYVIYSGHDSTCGAIDVFLKAEFNISYDNPEYTTSQYFELWENNNKYYIKYLVNQKEKSFYEYDEFREKITSKLFPQDEIEEICNGKERINLIIKRENIFKKLFLVVISIGLVTFLLLISLLLLEKKRKQF